MYVLIFVGRLGGTPTNFVLSLHSLWQPFVPLYSARTGDAPTHHRPVPAEPLSILRPIHPKATPPSRRHVWFGAGNASNNGPASFQRNNPYEPAVVFDGSNNDNLGLLGGRFAMGIDF